MDSYQLRRLAESVQDSKLLLELTVKVFHTLWGKAQEHSDYDKDLWCALQCVLQRQGVQV